jgi:aspartyl-tRNA(Asn)/glutamyl-tRNA(Gln) amidotransferase subunit A
VTLVTETDATCRERIEGALAAIEDAQVRYNAFTAIRPERALDEADRLDRLDRASPRGPLHGVPVVVKDLFDVEGLSTTGACAAYAGRVATSDAAVVTAVRAAGAIVVAKANQHELGAGATGLVSCFGPVANPIDPQRITGGSSSGSAAAVAAGAVPLAIGSDTGGSVRIPASFCGITGLRPTPGRISLAGAQPMSPGYDTAGPMARTAVDCATAFAALTHRPHIPTLDVSLTGVRVGLPEPYFQHVHPDTRAAVESAARAFESLGASVEWTTTPGLDPDFDGFRHVWADVAHHHHQIWDDPTVSDEVASLIDLGRRTSGLDYAASRAAADRVRVQFDTAFRRFDVLLTPATPYPAPRADEVEVAVTGGMIDVRRGGPSRMTVPVNEAAVPAIAFLVGSTTAGLPLGAQLIGPPYSDDRLLGIVRSYQEL